MSVSVVSSSISSMGSESNLLLVVIGLVGACGLASFFRLRLTTSISVSVESEGLDGSPSVAKVMRSFWIGLFAPVAAILVAPVAATGAGLDWVVLGTVLLSQSNSHDPVHPKASSSQTSTRSSLILLSLERTKSLALVAAFSLSTGLHLVMTRLVSSSLPVICLVTTSLMLVVTSW